jgi:hypothetical protein
MDEIHQNIKYSCCISSSANYCIIYLLITSKPCRYKPPPQQIILIILHFQVLVQSLSHSTTTPHGSRTWLLPLLRHWCQHSVPMSIRLSASVDILELYL